MGQDKKRERHMDQDKKRERHSLISAMTFSPSAFASFFCGTVQELPGGNLLVAESTQGRAIEIDGERGDVVWEYVSPRVIGDSDELIAALFMAERLPRPAWLQR